MARALWSGSIAFGLVAVPVELHPGVRESRPRFRLLHATDGAPVRLDRVCTRDGRLVAWNDLVKGYEYEKGRFVVLTKEDFKAAALEKTRTIDIRRFVDGQDIDDRFFETSYYLLPSKGGERAYALLREAMRASGLVGIATVVLRDVQHLAALEVVGNAIVLTQMRYPEELVDPSLYSFPDAKDLRKPEIEMARTLVERLAGRWNPSQYADQYRDNLMRIIRARLKGEKATLVEDSKPQPAEVVDLMERLRQSLDAARRRARKRTGAKAPTGRARRKHAA